MTPYGELTLASCAFVLHGVMRAISLLLAYAAFGLSGNCQVAPPEKLVALVGKTEAIRQTIEGWGTAVDPDGDCTFTLEDGALSISVPGGQPAHDLSAELNSSNAPRVLREISGDFTLQVCVHGESKPGDRSTQRGRTAYTGAGLAIFADSKNYIRLERATLKRGSNDASRHYTNFELRIDGRVQRFGNTGDLPWDDNKPVYLQLSRRGNMVHGAVSQDGKEWKELEPKTIEDWPSTILAGVAAISTSESVFVASFADIRTTNNPKPELEPVSASKETPVEK